MRRTRTTRILIISLLLVLFISSSAQAQESPLDAVSLADQRWIEEMYTYLNHPIVDLTYTFESIEPNQYVSSIKEYFIYKPRDGIALTIGHDHDPVTKTLLGTSRSLSYRTDIVDPDDITVGTLFSAALVYSERMDRLDAVALFQALYESLNEPVEGMHLSLLTHENASISLVYMENYAEYGLSIDR